MPHEFWSAIYLFGKISESFLPVTYPEFFGADQYTYRSHKDAIMVDARQRNFQSLCLKIL